jgi:hypothetical protein
MPKTDHAPVQVAAVDKLPTARELQIPDHFTRTLGQLARWLGKKVVADER